MDQLVQTLQSGYEGIMDNMLVMSKMNANPKDVVVQLPEPPKYHRQMNICMECRTDDYKIDLLKGTWYKILETRLTM